MMNITGVIIIEKDDKRIDWNEIRAEYIGGGTSYRKLAKKYGVSINILTPKAVSEGWVKMRTEAEAEATAKAQQKTAEIASDNATIAARIQTKLLRKLEREIDHLPDSLGTEQVNTIVEYDKNEKGKRVRKESTQARKLLDLAAMWEKLTKDMQKAVGLDVEDLSPLVELLKDE